MKMKANTGMQSAPIKRFNPEKCGECKCTLDLFTGKHIIVKDGKRKTVCGLCKSQLEVQGWKTAVTTK